MTPVPSAPRHGMRLHPILFLGLAGVLLKIAVGTAPDPRDPQALLDSASVLLAPRGYHIESAVQTTELTIKASRDACTVMLVEVRPQGWNTSRIQTLYGDFDRLFYLYRGEALRQAPTARATWNYQIARILGQLRLRSDWEPLWALLGHSACKPEETFAAGGIRD